jgi:hypothetical protein
MEIRDVEIFMIKTGMFIVYDEHRSMFKVIESDGDCGHDNGYWAPTIFEAVQNAIDKKVHPAALRR